MSSTPESLKTKLQEHDQHHVLAHWDKLKNPEQSQLKSQLDDVDFHQLKKLVADQSTGEDYNALVAKAELPQAIRLPPAHNAWNPMQALSAGRAALEAGQVGVIVVAGGQGTRLGFDKPKGMFPIGPVSHATLYQILAEGVLAKKKQFGQAVPLYVMTSDATDAETKKFFTENKNFGLPKKDVHFFKQGTMPAVDAKSGKLLLETTCSLAMSPDGHGGLVAAFAKSGCLDDAEQRGVKYLFYAQVDNPIVHLCDPEFIGYHILSASEMSSQVIAKRSPTEKVGNLVTIGGKTRIIEYSDLPAEHGERKTESGEPIFWAGSIAVHVIDVAFLKRVVDSPDGLPFHKANKKVPCLDESGEPISPDSPNAIKFERFIFDLLPLASEALALEVPREKAFAPVKNAPGEKFDTPETVKEQLIALHTGWLQDAGVEIAPGTPVEISPLAATSAAELAEKIKSGKIEVPKRIEKAYYLK
jgi:UDP-N-acetylglucosamine/UDP-N-acetylgalactosamine diphosphorylase